jgi:hypothetical protein
MRKLTFWLVVVLFFVGVLPVRADVQIAEKSIVDLQLLRSLKDYESSKLHVPTEPATNQDAIVVIRTGGAFADIRVLVKEDGKKIAQVIENVIGGTVYYRDDNEPAALAHLSTAKYGQTSAQITVPVGALNAALREAGYTPHAFLTLPKYALYDLPATAPREAKVADASNITQAVTFSATLTPAQQQLGFWLVNAPLIGIIGGIILSCMVGFFQRFRFQSTEKRALMLRALPALGILGMVLGMAWQFTKISSGEMRPVTDLWFGTWKINEVNPNGKYVNIAVVGVFALLWNFGLGRLLMGMNRQEVLAALGAGQSSATQMEQRQRARRMLPWLLVSAIPSVVCFGISMTLGKHDPSQRYWIYGALFGLIISKLLVLITMRRR